MGEVLFSVEIDEGKHIKEKKWPVIVIMVSF